MAMTSAGRPPNDKFLFRPRNFVARFGAPVREKQPAALASLQATQRNPLLCLKAGQTKLPKSTACASPSAGRRSGSPRPSFWRIGRTCSHGVTTWPWLIVELAASRIRLAPRPCTSRLRRSSRFSSDLQHTAMVMALLTLRPETLPCCSLSSKPSEEADALAYRGGNDHTVLPTQRTRTAPDTPRVTKGPQQR